MIRRLFTAASVLSLSLCMAIAVLWVRSYFKVDVVAIASTRLHRSVSGGGGLFLESLALQREDGSWRHPAIPSVRSTIDYNAWASMQPGVALRGWTTSPYVGRARLAGTSWGGDLNRARPRVGSVSFMRQQRFDNATGGLATFRLVGWRIWIPYWLMFVVTAFPAAYWLVRRPARLTGDGVPCPDCGYDLRASTGRCPECGMPIPAQAKT
jgi:hypothetical protein